jgi:TBC1 domain family member 15
MSDLCAPIYVVMGSDEELTFWCFVEVMNRMVRVVTSRSEKSAHLPLSQKQNFLRDQSGMKQQLLTLQQLICLMDPELYRHLENADGLNLFFCFRSVFSRCDGECGTDGLFRWVLIAFKREFAFEDILRFWEVLWTDYYSNQFVLFVALAILESHRDVILRYLVEVRA